MAISIVATAGSATANAFATEAAVIAYLATRLNLTGWTTVAGSTATEDEKKAMVEATRELSDLRWDGDRVDAVQALSWPRTGVYNLDDPDEAEYGESVIPVWLVEATAELAMEFLKAGTTDIASADKQAGVIRKVVGPLETEWESAGMRATGLARYPRVITKVERYLSAESIGGGLEVVRS